MQQNQADLRREAILNKQHLEGLEDAKASHVQRWVTNARQAGVEARSTSISQSSSMPSSPMNPRNSSSRTSTSKISSHTRASHFQPYNSPTRARHGHNSDVEPASEALSANSPNTAEIDDDPTTQENKTKTLIEQRKFFEDQLQRRALLRIEEKEKQRRRQRRQKWLSDKQHEAMELELKQNRHQLQVLLARQHYLSRRVAEETREEANDDAWTNEAQYNRILLKQQAELRAKKLELQQQRALLLKQQLQEQLSARADTSKLPPRSDPPALNVLARQPAKQPVPRASAILSNGNIEQMPPYHNSMYQLQACRFDPPPPVISAPMTGFNWPDALLLPPPALTMSPPLTQAPCWPSFTNFPPTLSLPLPQQPLLDELVFPLHPP